MLDLGVSSLQRPRCLSRKLTKASLFTLVKQSKQWQRGAEGGGIRKQPRLMQTTCLNTEIPNTEIPITSSASTRPLSEEQAQRCG